MSGVAFERIQEPAYLVQTHRQKHNASITRCDYRSAILKLACTAERSLYAWQRRL